MEIKKGPWTREEDHKLLAYIEEHGHGSWRALPAKAGLQRCGKSCRLRWSNYLSPHIKRGKFSSQEDMTIIRLHALLGNRWSSIATHLPKRTDNEIKNYWNTRLKKRLTRMGIDPATHKPKNTSAHSRQAANISHMAQWETARLEAEARLVRQSKLLPNLRKATARSPPQPVKPRCLDVLKAWQATNKNGFFSSHGTLESPTSTLNFSCTTNSSTVPTVGDHHGMSLVANDSILMNKPSSYEQVQGKMENLLQLHDQEDNSITNDHLEYDFNVPASAMDFVSVDNYFDTYNNVSMVGGGTAIEDFEDTKGYWNELLNLVSSPMPSPVF